MSNETKWTPAPWVVNERFSSPKLIDGDYCAITAGGGIYGAGCYEHDGFELTGYIGMANAHLIAAAPELYNILEKFERIKDLWLPADDIAQEHHGEAEAICATYREMLDVMAKARGEQ